MRTALIARTSAALAGLALALTACGGGGDPLSSGSGQTSPRPLPGSGLLPVPGSTPQKGILPWLSSRMS